VSDCRNAKVRVFLSQARASNDVGPGPCVGASSLNQVDTQDGRRMQWAILDAPGEAIAKDRQHARASVSMRPTYHPIRRARSNKPKFVVW
jgi:hypothetical protein